MIKVNLLNTTKKPRLRYETLVVALLVVLILFSVQRAFAFNTNIEGLKSIQERSRNSLRSADQEMMQIYSDSLKQLEKENNNVAATQAMSLSMEKLNRLLDIKQEESLRTEILDKLIFQLANRDGKKLQEELPKIIDEMVLRAMGINSAYSERDRATLPFLMNLALAIRTNKEPIENPLSFLETYLQYSPVLNPKPYTEFRNERGYLNDK